MSGIKTIIRDNVDGVLVERVQDVEPFLDANKADYNSGATGYTRSRAMKHVASIPPIVAELWLNTYGVDVFNKNHTEAVRRLLNSNEWRYLRTSPGRL